MGWARRLQTRLSTLAVVALLLGCSQKPASGPPTITAIGLAGAFDTQIRQGGHGSLVIDGTGLGEVDAVLLATPQQPFRVVPSLVSDTQVRAEFDEPHGQVVGVERVFVEGGGVPVASAASLEVTAINVSPHGDDASAGTRSAPFRTLFRALSVSGHGDTVDVAEGRYLASAESFPRDLDGGELPEFACNVPDGVNVVGTNNNGVVPRIVDDLDAGGSPLVFCGATQSSNFEIDGFGYGLVAAKDSTLTGVAIHGAQRDGALLLGGSALSGGSATALVDGCGRAGVHIVANLPGGQEVSVSRATLSGNGIGLLITQPNPCRTNLEGVSALENQGPGFEIDDGPSGFGSDVELSGEASRNGQSIPGSPGVLIVGAQGEIDLGSLTARDNSGDGVHALGSIVEFSVGYGSISGNQNGFWFATTSFDGGYDPPSFVIEQAQVTDNREAGIRIGGVEPSASLTSDRVAGNGVNLLVDSDFVGSVGAYEGVSFDRLDGGRFRDADGQGHERHGWIDDGGVQRISDAGITTGPFDWDADAGEGPFNYKLLSDAGRIAF